MAQLPAETIYQGPEVYKEFKGALAENFVLTELLNSGISMPFYWKSNNLAELDFIVQIGSGIVPVEVKSGRNNRSRSLAEYRKRYSPEIAVTTSLDNLSGERLRNIPLYLLWKFQEYVLAE